MSPRSPTAHHSFVVRAWRGTEIESRHLADAAVVDAEGHVLRAYGKPERRAFLRSAAKPVQAIPLVERDLVDKLGLTTAELAVATASHNAEPFHLEAVRGILDKAGVSETALQCGAHEPMLAAAAEALRARGESPTRIHNNCSGKHAAMLAVCRAEGWPLDSYRRPDHPLQRRIHALVAELSDLEIDEVGVAVDGCGAPTFSLPVTAAARLFARVAHADAARRSPLERAIGTILDAMAAHPEFVAGTGRLCTEIMRTNGDRVIVKTGAEGVYVAVRRGVGEGLALKIADGARRAQDVAVVSLLADLGWIDSPSGTAVAPFLAPEIENWGGEVVGRLDATLGDLEP